MLPNHIRRQYQFEVWQNPTASQDLKRLGFIEAPLRARYSASEGKVETLSFSVRWTDPARELIKTHALIYTQRLGGGDEQMWRVTRVTEVDQANGERRMDVRCEAAWADFGSGLLKEANDWYTTNVFPLAFETPAAIGARAIEAYRGFLPFELGTIVPTAEIESLEVDHDTGLTLMRKVETKANGRLWFQWDKVLRGYRVHLDDAAAAVAFSGMSLRPGRQLVSLSVDTDFATSAKRFHAKGATVNGLQLNLADADWVVSAVAGNQVTLVDDHGKRGPAPDDGWFVGARIRKACTVGDGLEVTGCTGSLDGPTVLTVSGILDMGSGDRVELLDEDGDRLAYIENPAAAENIVRRDRVLPTETPYHTNKLLGPELNDWPQAPGYTWPAHWGELGTGATFQRVSRSTNPDLVKLGHSAIRIIATAAGQGLKSEPFEWVKTDRLPVLASVAAVTPVSGKAEMYLEAVADGKKYPLTDRANIEAGDINSALTLSIHDVDVPSGQYRLCMESAGPAEWVFDAACVCPSVGNELKQVSTGGGGQVLFLDAARVAFYESSPVVTYEVDLVHLYGLDPEQFAEERLEVGKRIRVFDERLGVAVEVKVIEVEYSMNDTTFEGKVKLSNKREDVRDLLGGRKNTGGGQTPATQVRAVVKPTKLVYRDPYDGLTLLEFGIGKGDVLKEGAFFVEFDPFFLLETDVPEGWLPSATLQTTGVDIPLTKVLKEHEGVSYWIFVVEPFQAAMEGDAVLITVPPIRGVIDGTTHQVEILAGSPKYEHDGGRCGPGYVERQNVDGTWECILMDQIHFPPLPQNADFTWVADPANPGLLTFTGTADLEGDLPVIFFWEADGT